MYQRSLVLMVGPAALGCLVLASSVAQGQYGQVTCAWLGEATDCADSYYDGCKCDASYYCNGGQLEGNSGVEDITVDWYAGFVVRSHTEWCYRWKNCLNMIGGEDCYAPWDTCYLDLDWTEEGQVTYWMYDWFAVPCGSMH